METYYGTDFWDFAVDAGQEDGVQRQRLWQTARRQRRKATDGRVEGDGLGRNEYGACRKDLQAQGCFYREHILQKIHSIELAMKMYKRKGCPLTQTCVLYLEFVPYIECVLWQDLQAQGCPLSHTSLCV